MRDDRRKGRGPIALPLLIGILVATITPAALASPKRVAAGLGSSATLYVALGDSVATGTGASSPANGYVSRLFSAYQSDLGVTALSNRAQGGENSASIRTGVQLAAALDDIQAGSDTRAVTIEIGGNDRGVCANSWDTCPFRLNLAATLADLQNALDADPGAEAFVVMAYYNPASGSGGISEPYYDRQLLGSDLAVGCGTSAGTEVGLNDIVFQEAGRVGAAVADPYQAFKTAGQSFMADGLHPNDAGHAAIADAFRYPSAGCASFPPLPAPDPDPGPAPDPVSPETTITSGPKHRTHPGRVTFKFRSSKRASTFECKLDDKPFRGCVSPHRTRRLSSGRHRFKVRATDAFGNTDSTPSTWRWRIR